MQILWRGRPLEAHGRLAAVRYCFDRCVLDTDRVELRVDG